MTNIHKCIFMMLCIATGYCEAQTISLFGLFEIELTNKKNYLNPFSDVELIVHYTSPTNREIRFFGFYDGDGNGGQHGNIWKIRFMPDESGKWKYRYYWSDDTPGGTGEFITTVENAKPGPWRVNQQNPYWLQDAHGNHFLPIALIANIHLTPVDWRDAIQWAISKGYNTIITPTINTTNWGNGWDNTTAFIKAYGKPYGSASGYLKWIDPDRYNLKMWHEWDNMIKTAGEHGIYIAPFEGPSGKYGGQDGKYQPEELVFRPKIRERFDSQRNERFIKYYVARQGAFWNLAYWSLGSTEVHTYAVDDENEFQEYVSYLASITPWKRMITAQDCEQWHGIERRWLSSSSIPYTRKLNTLQTSISSPANPHWGGNDIKNT